MVPFFKFFPEPSLEEKHKNGDQHKEKEEIRSISLGIPDSDGFEKKKCGNK
jgi:hypothetical protein